MTFDRSIAVIGKLKALEDDQYNEPSERFTPEQIAEIADDAKIEIRLLIQELAALKDKAHDLMRYAVTRADLGVFYAGQYHAKSGYGDVWKCRGCEAEYVRDHGHPNDYDASTFKHEDNCKYQAALDMAGMKAPRHAR